MGSHKKAKLVVLKASYLHTPGCLTAGVMSDVSKTNTSAFIISNTEHFILGTKPRCVSLPHKRVTTELTVFSFNLHQPGRGAHNNILPVKQFSFFVPGFRTAYLVFLQ